MLLHSAPVQTIKKNFNRFRTLQFCNVTAGPTRRRCCSCCTGFQYANAGLQNGSTDLIGYKNCIAGISSSSFGASCSSTLPVCSIRSASLPLLKISALKIDSLGVHFRTLHLMHGTVGHLVIT